MLVDIKKMDNNFKLEGLLEHCHFVSEPCFHWCAQLSWLQTCFQTSLCPFYPSFAKVFGHVIQD
jgi:hypothetical protein